MVQFVHHGQILLNNPWVRDLRVRLAPLLLKHHLWFSGGAVHRTWRTPQAPGTCTAKMMPSATPACRTSSSTTLVTSSSAARPCVASLPCVSHSRHAQQQCHCRHPVTQQCHGSCCRMAGIRAQMLSAIAVNCPVACRQLRRTAGVVACCATQHRTHCSRRSSRHSRL